MTEPSTFVFVLPGRGHDTVAPDLPCDDETAGLDDYIGAVTGAAADRPAC